MNKKGRVAQLEILCQNNKGLALHYEHIRVARFIKMHKKGCVAQVKILCQNNKGFALHYALTVIVMHVLYYDM